MEAEISRLVQRITKCKGKNISEWDTASLFVEPVLSHLGWDTFDIEQVNRESRRRWQLGDLQLLLPEAGSPKIAAVLEIKHLDLHRLEGVYDELFDNINLGLWEHNDDWNYGHRLCRSCDRAVFVRGVVTNGRHWIVYDLTAKPGEISLLERTSRQLCNIEFEASAEQDLELLKGALGKQALVKALGRSLCDEDPAA